MSASAKHRTSRGAKAREKGAEEVLRPRYFNRELSWLEFDHRVLEEAMCDRHPLLERLKFLSIFHSNLDEFFMIRVSGLKEQLEAGMSEQSEDGLTVTQQLAVTRERVLQLQQCALKYYEGELITGLARIGIRLYDWKSLSAAQKSVMEDYFQTSVYPVLTPLAVDPGHPFPHISNLSLNLAVVIRDREGVQRFARVKIPQVLPRLVPVPAPPDAPGQKGFLWLEQLIAVHLDSLFRGMKILKSYPFRVIRDADLEIREDEAGDLLQTIEASLSRRRFGSVVMLEIDREMPRQVQSLLVQNLEIVPADVYPADGPLGMSDIMALYELDLPEHKDPPFRPHAPASLKPGSDLFAEVRAGDIVLHHPYDSFAPIVEMVKAAAADPDVLAIKQTIYRVGKNSPIVAALAEAANEGKQVAVMVELKARFDEEDNIGWARALEKAGVHVVYGDVELKTHCKVLLIVRRERNKIRRYVHLGTGNYNVRTARLYTDLSLLTCDPALGEDATALFNVLTGYSRNAGYQKLLVSPDGIRQGLRERIEREIEHAKAGRGGHVALKMNSLTDFQSVNLLYRASQAGVKVDLIIRSSCCLVPGIPGLSDNIRVISIVGRFLEHHRIYYFRNGGGGKEEVWLGSADIMQRNLDRRFETLFPIDRPALKLSVIQDILLPHLRDNQKAWELSADGIYRRLATGPGEEPFDVQEWFLRQNRERAESAESDPVFALPRPPAESRRPGRK